MSTQLLNALLNLLTDTLQHHTACQHLWVAYSGGLDSQVLLHALTTIKEQLPFNIQLRALHIHHGLQPQAEQWVTHCKNTSKHWKIPCDVLRINIIMGKGDSLEACARTARYTAIIQHINVNDIVLTAHHADDQAETVLLQLLRGAGVAGLSGMPTITPLGQGWLLRPFLSYTRAELLTYAQQTKLTWVEDNSNADTRFDRNFLRHEILPRLRQRWKQVSHILSRVANHQAQANTILQTVAEQDLQLCIGQQPNQLYLSAFIHLDKTRQANLLRSWLKTCGLPLPSSVQLQHILNDLLLAKHDRCPVVRWRGAEIRRYQDTLFAMSPLPPISPHIALEWILDNPLTLPYGTLTAIPCLGKGLTQHLALPLRIRLRKGGERCRLQGHERSVKKILQSTNIPPWQRDFIPLIFQKNILIAIPNVCICDGFTAQRDEMGWYVQWALQ